MERRLRRMQNSIPRILRGARSDGHECECERATSKSMRPSRRSARLLFRIVSTRRDFDFRLVTLFHRMQLCVQSYLTKRSFNETGVTSESTSSFTRYQFADRDRYNIDKSDFFFTLCRIKPECAKCRVLFTCGVNVNIACL